MPFCLAIPGLNEGPSIVLEQYRPEAQLSVVLHRPPQLSPSAYIKYKKTAHTCSYLKTICYIDIRNEHH